MRAVVQRVLRAEVRVEGGVVGSIEGGLLVLLGVGHDDDAVTARALADKIAALRIFADERGRMHRALLDVGGSVLLVSQFTLFGDARRGNRPSFTAAAPPELAQPLVDAVAGQLRDRGVHVEEGVFGAAMAVTSTNDGPVTIWLDTADAAHDRG